MNKNQQYLEEAILQYQNRDYDFPVVDDLSKVPEHYRGEVLEINDHGNVTLWYKFKNGNYREIASRV